MPMIKGCYKDKIYKEIEDNPEKYLLLSETDGDKISENGKNAGFGDERKCLFNWENVSKDNKECIKFLKDCLKIEWVENVEVVKDNDKTLTITNKENKEEKIILKLDKAKKQVTLEIAGGKTHEYILREESSNLNIYDNSKVNVSKIRMMIKKCYKDKIDKEIKDNPEKYLLLSKDKIDDISNRVLIKKNLKT
ncbi:MAG: hypothetical protein BWK75_03605 [Candidatus Altiarchaeales archaeon A3]|nr:MAG: hypothetical protein BWK75_03605 [Candidatus Altiarchaeales archaeon A3]